MTLAAGAKPQQVYFFATCVVDLFWPQAGLHAVTLIERCGIRVVFPRAQTCCGQPAYTTGFPGDARAVAAAQLELFAQPWPIVVPSGSCGGMLKHHWPLLFKDDPARLSLAQDIAARTMEFSEFAAQHLNLSAASIAPIKVALHTSCSARREMGTLACGRKLLAQSPGVQRVEHTHEAECCGFGGTFAVKHPEISAAMTADKLDALKHSGCDTYVSADCGCLLNLNGAAEKRGDSLRGEHLATFLLRRLDA